MTFPFTLKAGIALAVAAAAMASAHAAPTTFVGFDGSANGQFVPAGNADAARGNFLSTLQSSLTEGLTNATTGAVGLAPGSISIFGATGATLQQNNPAPVDPLRTGGAVRATVSGGAVGRFNTTPGVGGVVGSGKWWDTDWNFQLTLGSFIDSFGFFATDLGDFTGGLQIDLFNTVTNQTVATNVFNNSGAPIAGSNSNGSLLFFGFSDSALSFNRILFKISQPASTNGLNYDRIGFDDFTIGTARPSTGVPEPTSLALVGLSLGLLGTCAQRRSKAKQG